jgi:ribosomal protein S12 methylthiotransferase accessory factor
MTLSFSSRRPSRGRSILRALSSIERSVPTERSIVACMEVLANLGTVSYHALSQRYPRQIGAVLTTDRFGCASGSGKGDYPQNLVSALFEVLEHAICRGVIAPREAPVGVAPGELYLNGTLPIDAVAQYLRTAQRGLLPAVRFRLVSDPSQPCDVWLPAAMYHPPINETHDVAQRFATGYWSTNGYAAGMNAAEALLHAVNEVIERDALSHFLLECGFGNAVGTSVVLRDGLLSELKSDVEQSTGSSIDVRVIPALAGTVAVAIGSRFNHHGCRLLGEGSSTNAAYAIERALMEYEQVCAVAEEGSTDRQLIENYPFQNSCYRCDTIPPPLTRAEFRQAAVTETATVAAQLATKVQKLHDAGYPVLGRTLFSGGAEPDQDAPTVVQAVVLGAEQFHLVTKGIVVEPIARLRSAQTMQACRQQLHAKSRAAV